MVSNIYLTISLCMIVKNEERHLGDCLSSVKGAVDEIIVVDTGSTDNTKLIAADHGGIVYDLAWDNDFSKARNFAIQHATGDWILILDADEELFSEDISKLRKISRSTEMLALTLQIIDTEINEIFSHSRMFKSAAKPFYIGKLHEQPSFDGDNSKSVCTLATDIRILHKGYAPEVSNEKQKVRRNMALFKQITEEDPNNASNIFHLGRQYQAMKEFDKAIEQYLIILRQPFIEDRMVFKYLMQCYEAKKDPVKAIEIATMGLKMFPDYVDLLFEQGLNLMIIKQYQPAIGNFRRCLELPLDLGAATSIPGSQGILSKLFLALASYETTKDPKLYTKLDHLMKELSRDSDALFFLGKHYKNTYGKEFAKKEISRIADLRDPKITKMFELLSLN